MEKALKSKRKTKNTISKKTNTGKNIIGTYTSGGHKL
jgi:hypothetical protein